MTPHLTSGAMRELGASTRSWMREAPTFRLASFSLGTPRGISTMTNSITLIRI